MFTNVVIAIKPGVSKAPLIDLAVQAAPAPATLHLVTLVQVGKDQNELDRLAQTEADSEKTAADLRERGYEVSTYTAPVAVGAAIEINNYAEEQDADLIVIGLAKRSRVSKALIGSDAQRILLSSGRAVLSAPLMAD